MINFLKSLFGTSPPLPVNDILAKGAILIDVRSASEFANGHAKAALNIPLDQLESKLATLKSYRKTIVLCCASGMRSARAKAFLAGHNVPDLHDAGSWRTIK